MTKRPYVPAPVNMDAIDQAIAQSIATIERSYALLSRLNVDHDNRYLCGRLLPQTACPDRTGAPFRISSSRDQRVSPLSLGVELPHKDDKCCGFTERLPR